jgi:hypothetical protein
MNALSRYATKPRASSLHRVPRRRLGRSPTLQSRGGGGGGGGDAGPSLPAREHPTENSHGTAAGPVQRAGRTQVRAGGLFVAFPWRARWKEPPTRAAGRDFIRLRCRNFRLVVRLAPARTRPKCNRLFGRCARHRRTPHRRTQDWLRNFASERWICKPSLPPSSSSPSLTMQVMGQQAGNALVYNPLDPIRLHDPDFNERAECGDRHEPSRRSGVQAGGTWRRPAVGATTTPRAPPMDLAGGRRSHRRRHPVGRLCTGTDGRSRSRARRRFSGPCRRPYLLSGAMYGPDAIHSSMSVVVVVMESVAAAPPPSDILRAVARGTCGPARAVVLVSSPGTAATTVVGACRADHAFVRSFVRSMSCDPYHPPPMPDDNANPFHAPESWHEAWDSRVPVRSTGRPGVSGGAW